MTAVNNNPNSSNISPKDLNNLKELGFKLVPLGENDQPSMKWGIIYYNPNYWKLDSFKDPMICSNFKNIATALGKTHLKDTNNDDLFIQALDIDSEHVYHILTTSINQLKTSSNLK